MKKFKVDNVVLRVSDLTVPGGNEVARWTVIDKLEQKIRWMLHDLLL